MVPIQMKLFKEKLGLDLIPKIIFKDILPPLTLERINSSKNGSVTGWVLSHKVISVYTNLKCMSKSVLTPVKDIYQFDQWAFAPAGVPITILIGKLATDKTLKKKGEKR